MLEDFEHPKNKTGVGKKYIFENPKHGCCYPDFCGANCVLDAKYKGKTDIDVYRPDTFQLISYLHILGLRKGGFIVPATGADVADKSRTLAETGGDLALFRLAVPQNAHDCAAFCEAIKHAEKQLLEAIHQFEKHEAFPPKFN